jgi:hypothetical protein
MVISKRASERAVSGLKRLMPIIQQQKSSGCFRSGYSHFG